MLMPPQITFRGMGHSPEIEVAVLGRVSWLEQFYKGLVSCHVLIEAPNRHRRDGRPLHVTIELTVPNGEPIVISHAASLRGPLEDAGAIHDAFDVARRRLQDFARQQRGAIKRHETPR